MKRSDSGAEGLLLVDKSDGPTSHDVVRCVRKALGTRRVGHAGTLDPFATGLLACCAGRATRLLKWLTASDKTYEGVIRFGFATNTGDRTGTPLGELRESGVSVSLAEAEEAVARRLTGELEQIPPMWSAKKIGGVPLHEMARRGEHVEREAARVRVTDWQLERLDAVRLRFRVTCSAGTYVRVLAYDLGELLGCGAHLESLRRTRSGALRVEDAVPFDALDPESARRALVPLDAIPVPLPRVRLLDERAEDDWAHGRIVAASGVTGGEGLAAGDEAVVEDCAGHACGVGRWGGAGLQPGVVLARPEESPDGGRLSPS